MTRSHPGGPGRWTCKFQPAAEPPAATNVSDLTAALKAVRGERPAELIAAVPVAPRELLPELEAFCDEAVCLLAPPSFAAVAEFYEDFTQVSEEEVLALLRRAAAALSRGA